VTSELNQEITTSTKLAELRAEGKTLTLQELDELDTRVTALEKMARIEDRLRRLESRKRSSDTLDEPRDQSNVPVRSDTLPLLTQLPEY
jgi:hypothetical protein